MYQGELWYLFYGALPRSDYSCLPKSEVNIEVLCMGHGLQMLLNDLCVFLVPKVYKYFIAVQAEQWFWNFHDLVFFTVFDLLQNTQNKMQSVLVFFS